MSGVTESVIEEAALAWIESLGWAVAHGPDIAPDTPGSERADYGQVVLEQRLRDALARLNPDLPAEAQGDAFRKLTRLEGPELTARNRAFHRLAVDGVTVEYRTEDGTIRGAQARVIDFDDPSNNDWLAVNQFTVTEDKHTRRPDVVLFVNGLPLGVIELKNAADEEATIWTAWQQLQTYKAELPALFAMNELLMVSDGTQARAGTLTAGREWFKPWRTIAGETLADPRLPELQVAIEGLLDREHFLALVRDFIVFEDAGGETLAKKMTGYHQFHAVRVAVAETLRAARLQAAGEPSVGPTTGVAQLRPRVVRAEPEERYATCVPLGTAPGRRRSLWRPAAHPGRRLRVDRHRGPPSPAPGHVRGPGRGPVHGAQDPRRRMVSVLGAGRRNTPGQDGARSASRRGRSGERTPLHREAI